MAAFRNRSESASRLEGFIDTTFGFAITLGDELAKGNKLSEPCQHVMELTGNPSTSPLFTGEACVVIG